MRTPSGCRDARYYTLIPLIASVALIGCGGGETSGPTEPDPNAVKYTTLVPADARNSSPRWSPDGSTVVFTKDIRDTPQAGIYTVNVFVVSAKGGSQTQLSNQTDNADAASPLWSPDGASVAFSSPKSGDPFYQTDRDLWIVSATGGTPTECGTLPADSDPLRPDDYYDALVSDWSPDGTKILFNSPSQPNTPCCQWKGLVVPIGGGDPIDLSADASGKALRGWSWSPDGTSIACSAVTPGSNDSDIYTAPAAGGTPTPLVATSAIEDSPGWSPDGSTIVYSSLIDEQCTVWTLPASGGQPARVAEVASAYSGEPLWAPDGRYIVFSAMSASGTSRLWLVPSVGGTPIKLAQVDYQHAWYPSWSPDGLRLVFVTGSGGIAIASNLPDIN